MLFIIASILVALNSAQSGNDTYAIQCVYYSCPAEISTCMNDKLCSQVWSCLINDCVGVSSDCFGGCMSLDNQSNTVYGLFYECALPCLGSYGRL